jgi:hypothetical protein
MKRSRLLPVAVIFLLVSLLCLPATAADNSTPSGDVAIRQAHLAWTALDMDLEMNAAITYCSTLYGSDTSTMSTLLAEFREEEGRVPRTASGKEVDALIAGMRNTTGQFRIETGTVMAKGQGKWDDLARQVFLAKDNNPYLSQKKENYWAVRTATQLAAFDQWVEDGQQYLDTLKGEGYDVTTAQRALDVFSSRRPDVKAAYAAKTDDAVQSVNAQILPLSRDFITSLAAVQELVPDSTRFGFFIDQGNRAVGEADRVNIALVPILLDIGDAETILSKTKTDLSQARTLLNTGNLGSTKTPLRLVRKDFTDLSQAYRDIVARTELPPDLTTELNALASRLDRTADQMGAAL